MVDIHVIPSPGFDENLVKILQALQHPQVHVQIADYVEGDILAARLRAYSLGDCPYVSWVDGDDRVLDIKWIELAVFILDSCPHISAVYPRWTAIKNGKVKKTPPIHVWDARMHSTWSYLPMAHHLTVMRKHQVLELLGDAQEAVGGMVKSQDRYLMSALVRHGQLVSLDDVAYEWHLRPNTGRSAQDSPKAIKWCRKRAVEDVKLARALSLDEASKLLHAKALFSARHLRCV